MLNTRVDIISEEIKPYSKIKVMIMITTSLLILLPAASASSVAAKNVHITSKYVSAIALCSCGLNGYHYTNGTFKNYCPLCHSYGTYYIQSKMYP